MSAGPHLKLRDEQHKHIATLTVKKRLYHRTSAKAAASILKIGFREGNIIPIEGIRLRGVWLSSKPLETHEGAKSDEALFEVEVNLPKTTFDYFELVEERKPYREWCFPAKLLRNAKVREIRD